MIAIIKKIIGFPFAKLFIVYLCILAILYNVQASLLFPAPDFVPQSLPEYAQFAEMQMEDGKTLRHIRLQADEGSPKLMFFHGNGMLSAYELERGRILQENGFDVLLVEYRGYGGSEGSPSADAILKDSLAIYDWYKSSENDWVFLYAHSLGTGVASYLASQRSVQSMVLEAPYAVLSDVVASKYPVFPVRSLFKHEIKSAEYLKGSTVPTLILHGDQDDVIPIEFGEDLHKSLDTAFSEMKVINNAGHNNLIQYGSVELALEHFIKAF